VAGCSTVWLAETVAALAALGIDPAVPSVASPDGGFFQGDFFSDAMAVAAELARVAESDVAVEV
jgi:hypothetical protein